MGGPINVLILGAGRTAGAFRASGAEVACLPSLEAAKLALASATPGLVVVEGREFAGVVRELRDLLSPAVPIVAVGGGRAGRAGAPPVTSLLDLDENCDPDTIASAGLALAELGMRAREAAAGASRTSSMDEAEKIEGLVDAIGAGLAIMDGHRRFLWANKFFTDWFGDPAGRLCPEIFHPDETRPRCPALAVLSSGRPENELWRIYSPDGARSTYQATFTRVTEPDGSHSLIALVRDETRHTDLIDQMKLLGRIREALQGVRDLNRLLHLVLTCVTSGHAFGFNRAFLFMRNKKRNTLDGKMAVGPASLKEALRIWGELSRRQQDLDDALGAAMAQDAPGGAAARPGINELIRDLSYPVEGPTSFMELPVRVLKERKTVHVLDAGSDPRVSAEFRERFSSREFVAVPLVSKGASLGVIVADNIYNGRPVSEEQIYLLETFSGPAGLALDNAETFADLSESLEVLRRTRRQLVDQTKLAAIGRVAAHIAHEIRNPLTTIGGFAHVITKRPEQSDSVRRNAETIVEEVRRLERMLSGIMDFSRPTRPVAREGDLNDTVSKAAEVLRGECEGKGIALETDLDPSLPRTSFDPEQMHQVITNLVRNAAESMSEGAGRVRISTRCSEPGVILAIEDDGPGIPEGLHARIFEPFFTTKRGGTGLGLAVCRQIVAEHGGALRVRSGPGRGTTFTVELPPEPPPPIEEVLEGAPP